jgi:hypothetical protein
MKINKTIIYILITFTNLVLLTINYPFLCKPDNTCSVTYGYLGSMILFVPIVFFNFGLLYYFWRQKGLKVYKLLSAISIIYLLVTYFQPQIGDVIRAGFDIDAADRGIYPTFSQMAISSYLSLFRLLLPLNILFAYLILRSKHS